MARIGEIIVGALSGFFVAALPTIAKAQAQTPTISGNSWIAYAIIGGLVLLVLLFISGVIGISKRDTGDDDEENVGILEGIEEDDPKPRRRR